MDGSNYLNIVFVNYLLHSQKISGITLFFNKIDKIFILMSK